MLLKRNISAASSDKDKNGGSSPPLRPSKKTKGILSSFSSSPLMFAYRTAANYLLCYCADGSPTGRKSFTWPFDRKLKEGSLIDLFDGDTKEFFENNFMGSFPRRATVDNDPVLYTFVPKQYNNDKPGFYSYKKKEQEKKALPWNVRFNFSLFIWQLECAF